MIDSNDSIALKDIISAASPLIKSLVDTFVTPKLVSFKDKFKPKEKTFLLSEENFKEYYHRTYKKLIVVNTLVFNNSQRFLPDIFIPLTLTATNNEKFKIKVDGYPETLSDEFGNILITDTAGMGKSTLMKTIFIDLINKNLGIPIFIELRRLNKNKSIIDEIKEQLNSINKPFNSNSFFDLLSEGGFIIILDGYDEIALSDKDIVTKDIQDFITKASNNRFFITSRPEKALSSFGNFQEFKISPLHPKEAFELLRKYDNQGQTSSLLISKLQENEMKNVEEFLTNPLLVSLLFTAFEHKHVIPFKKYLFYRQVYDANFESHDLTKGESYTHDKYSNLEIDDFHRVLRHIGFNCFKEQKIEFSKDEILKLILESKTFCAGLSFKESDFLQDILITVPLFTQDGNYYRWCHKSLQEYFAAQFIYLDSKEKQNDILLRLYNHQNLEKFVNVLDLYYDMDYKTFRNTIELKLLSEFIDFYNSNYLEFNNIIDLPLIDKRKELMFLMKSFLFKASYKGNKRHFDGEKISNMFTDNEIKNNLETDKFNGILMSTPLPEGLFCVHFQNSKTAILTLLANKKSNLIRNIDLRQIQHKPIFIEYNIEKEYELKPITDFKVEELNSSTNFENTNKLLEATRLFPVTINTKQAFLKIKEIQESIIYEKQTDFLLGGI